MPKCIFDLLFGFSVLIFALPIMALSVLLVYCEDGLPVIFRQKRVGMNGRLFEMFKIRTVKDAEQLQSQAVRRDSNGNLIHKDGG